MARKNDPRVGFFPKLLDPIINWAHANSLWPMYFGLSCCFIEEATVLTPRYDIARFGAEVFRLSPRQADLMIISGTVFKKVAPVVLRIYEQMAEPKWVISMGSCANTGGMYDVYGVVQGINQILPVDVYIPGCPPRPEAILAGLTCLQEKIKNEEKPTRSIFHLGGGTQGSVTPILVDGETKHRDTRGPGMEGIPIRGSAVTPPEFFDSRSDLMWTLPAYRIESDSIDEKIVGQLQQRFGKDVVRTEPSSDMLTLQLSPEHLVNTLDYLKQQAEPRFERLDDITAIDESARRQQEKYPDFTMVYHLLSFDPAKRIRVKVPFYGEYPETESIVKLWPNANWMEREVYDMFGIGFKGHPNLRRLIMPPDWTGHPLRKSHPDRATEIEPYTIDSARKYQPWGGEEYFGQPDEESLILNVGPHHTATHGLLRIIVKLKGEIMTDVDMDIGYHHRSVEKLGERQTWLQFVPYTDRVDYMAGAANELPYVMAVEQLGGVKVPERAQYIRVLLSELFRISGHLALLGIMGHDVGTMTPNFYTFRDREYVMDIVEMISGARLHPAWFRIGGVANDLPMGWKEPIKDFIKIFPKRLDEYKALTIDNPIFKARTRGVGILSRKDAIEWGVSGPNLRAAGVAWDLRKSMPYSGYDQFDFEIPTHSQCDSWTRYWMRIEECRQSLKIIEQVVDKIPEGRYVTDDYRYAVPARKDMLNDIESLIHHFINVTRGPKIPVGESFFACEIPRGEQYYYVVSDGLGSAYRMHMRGNSFAVVQALPVMARGRTLSDLVAILGSIDYTLPDMDR